MGHDERIWTDEEIHDYYDKKTRRWRIFFYAMLWTCVAMLPFMAWTSIGAARSDYAECMVRDYQETYTTRAPFAAANPAIRLDVSYVGQLDRRGVLVFDNAGNLSETRAYYAPGQTLLCTICSVCFSKMRKVSTTRYEDGLVSGGDWGRGTLKHAFDNETAHTVSAITIGSTIGAIGYLCVLLAVGPYEAMKRRRRESLERYDEMRTARMNKISSTGGVYQVPVELHAAEWLMPEHLLSNMHNITNHQ